MLFNLNLKNDSEIKSLLTETNAVVQRNKKNGVENEALEIDLELLELELSTRGIN